MTRLLALTALILWGGTSFAQSTFTVTSAADPGSGSCDVAECTLREAILAANASPNGAQPDRIHFAIPGNGLHSITPLTPLPSITGPVVIDGYTQPGARANTLAVGENAVLLVEINGNGANFRVFEITGGSSTIRGFVINRFDGNGATDAFQLRTFGGNLITGNWIGTSADGTTALNNSRAGIYIWNSAGNVIGGPAPADRNVILGSANPAIYDEGTGGGHTIQGNYIGTNAQGTLPLGLTGIYLSTANNRVGGTTPGAGNVISVTGRPGVVFLEGGANDNRVEGNFVGVGSDGTAPLGLNASVLIQRGSDNLIGGPEPGARNVLAGSTGVRIVGSGSAAERNRVQGNLMGLTASGTALVLAGGGAGGGVEIVGAYDTAVGGTEPGAGNTIAGFAIAGVYVDFTGAPVAGNAVIQGNRIGTDASGTVALGNATGVILFGSAPAGGTVLGGPEDGAGNVISGNRGDGVSINGPANVNVQGNSIGVAADGTSPLGNVGHGVVLASGSNTISGNVIAYSGAGVNNLAVGVWVTAGTAISIVGNSMFGNAQLGIDLYKPNSPAATPNDPGDPDEGANRLQNSPEITSATQSAGQLTVTYFVDTALTSALYQLRVQFFLSEGGQGAALVGSEFYSASDYDACGSPPCPKSFSFVPAVPLPPGAALVATATDRDGDTSEFSAAASISNGVDAQPEVVARTALLAPSPNPARGLVTVRYTLAETGLVGLTLTDVLGREVAVVVEEARPAGAGDAELDTSTLAAGTYVLRLTAAGQAQTRRIIVSR